MDHDNKDLVSTFFEVYLLMSLFRPYYLKSQAAPLPPPSTSWNDDDLIRRFSDVAPEAIHLQAPGTPTLVIFC